jgi:DNA polymerase-3 subunit gamma/tau
VGRCQRFDFRRIGTEPLADLLQTIAGREGFKLTREAAEQLARQAEGSARDAESLLDQTAVLGGGTITEDTVALLIGTGEEDLPFELADAIAVADGGAVFEAVDRMVQEGHDLRHATGQILQHVRDLLVVHSAPEEPRALDASPERHARLVSQAAKFSLAELSRILALLVAAQTDMRWTTSPRLTLELALVRSAIPEADPNPAGLASRIERLERLAGIEGAVVVAGEVGGAASAGHAPPYPRSGGAPDHHVHAPSASDPPAAGSLAGDGADRADDVVQVPDGEPTGVSDVGDVVAEAVAPAAPVGAHAPDAGALDVGTIRRSWGQLVTHLQQQRQMILAANLDSVTAAAYDGATLELAFPPGRRFAVRKVEERGDQLREALTAVFGISPRIVCSERGVTGTIPEVIEDDDPPPAPDELLERFRSEFGAEVVDAEGE